MDTDYLKKAEESGLVPAESDSVLDDTELNWNETDPKFPYPAAGSTIKKARGKVGIGKIFARYGTWVVTNYGIENLVAKYYISKDRLWEEDWIDHVRGRFEEGDSSFTKALYFARSYHEKVKLSLERKNEKEQRLRDRIEELRRRNQHEIPHL